MGLFGRKRQPPTAELPYAILPGGRTVDVVGEAFYQDALEAVAGGKTEDSCTLEKWAVLVREPENPYDSNAVAIYILGQRVGYLSRDDAEEYSILIDELWRKYGVRPACRASLTGGWRRYASDGKTIVDEGHYGVRLALAAPERLLGSQTFVSCDDEYLQEPPPPFGA
jgi:HIRAN domain